MNVRRNRKLADQLDGVNVSQKHVGDVLDLGSNGSPFDSAP